ncbi:amino acid transporter [Rhodopila globiformis]|uniref:Uncharacterized protein n=1 Tax=Rhodopila globiformis TaxID=1071 RepID=A0A2S6N9J1_RHOGL|nr:amino acid transporter [Rhodopila globiformis]PPQ31283.1 hypothetical protein CCS01_17620 [Rhodopila globiformis]
MSNANNERARLIATTINNVAVAFLVAGFIAPEVNGQLASTGRFTVTVTWCLLAAGLHLTALAVLGGLDE